MNDENMNAKPTWQKNQGSANSATIRNEIYINIALKNKVAYHV